MFKKICPAPADNHGYKLSARIILIFILSFACCSFFIYHITMRQENLEKVTAQRVILEKTQRLSNLINRLLYRTHALAALVIESNGDTKDFDKVATAMSSDPAIRNMLLAPDGIVSRVYPMPKEKALLGFDLFSGYPGGREAHLAKESGQLVFGGPFPLMQGGMGLVGRLPVFIDTPSGGKRFWGLVAVTLDYQTVFELARFNSIDEMGLVYEIWRINPDNGIRQTIAGTNLENVPPGKYVELPMRILNAHWQFRISGFKPWFKMPEVLICLGLGLLLSCALAFLAWRNAELQRVRRKLEAMVFTDTLTGIANRQALFIILQKLLGARKPFEITYIDLNHFKQINDSYGHNTGDLVLKEFVCRFTGCLVEGLELARISGDEFLLLNTRPTQDMQTFWEKIEEEFSRPIETENGDKVLITFSRGTSSYPEHGSSVEGLLNDADRKMYDNKHRLYQIYHKRRASDLDVVKAL